MIQRGKEPEWAWPHSGSFPRPIFAILDRFETHPGVQPALCARVGFIVEMVAVFVRQEGVPARSWINQGARDGN